MDDYEYMGVYKGVEGHSVNLGAHVLLLAAEDRGDSIGVIGRVRYDRPTPPIPTKEAMAGELEGLFELIYLQTNKTAQFIEAEAICVAESMTEKNIWYVSFKLRISIRPEND
jgi:hypothetical protein